MTVIRLATPTDAPALAALRFEFRASVNEAVETDEAFLARTVPWMGERLADRTNWYCWLAEGGDTIAGHLWLQLIEKVPNPAAELEWHAYVTNVYVRPAARGTGTGAALVEAALAFCRERGVDSVILWPTEKSRPLYTRHGFAVRENIMEALLDDGRHL